MFTKESIENYFTVFKNEQIFLMVIGAVAFVTAVIFYAALKTNWYKGFALPLAVFALINIGSGYQNYTKADALRVRNVYNYSLHRELLTKELGRVMEMNQNLRTLIYINICIIFSAGLIFLYFKKKNNNEYFMGMAASLFLVAVLSVAMYSVMNKTGENYEKGLISFTERS